MDYKVIWLDEVDSTNLEAKRLAVDGCPEWTVVAARRQKFGRGRLGRSWASLAGGLFFSVVLRPDEAFANPGLLTVSAGVAVTRAVLRVSGIKAVLKWPNDVYAGGRKLSGILAERRLSNIKQDFTVLGIGVNVNNESFPDDMPNATSMFLEQNATYDINQVLEAILYEFRGLYTQIITTGGANVINYYKTLCLNIGNTVILRKSANGSEITGVALDIAQDGALVVKTTGGERISVNSGDVTMSVKE